MKKKKIPVYHFLSEDEIVNIIKLIQKIENYETRARFYLVTLDYKSVDIQNFTIEQGENMLENPDVPETIKDTLKKVIERRKISIESNDLKIDTKYLFVTSNNKHIHDRVLLMEWRRFLTKNSLGDISMNIFRQSIKYLNHLKAFKTKSVMGNSSHDEEVFK